jgi:hypothetical protein
MYNVDKVKTHRWPYLHAGKFSFAFAGSADKMRGPLQSSASIATLSTQGGARWCWMVYVHLMASAA